MITSIVTLNIPGMMIFRHNKVDPLICPKYPGTMRIISSIEDREFVKTILQYLGIWTIRSKPTAKAHAPPTREYTTDGACQTVFPDNAAYGDPDYPWEAYVKNKTPRKIWRQERMSA